MRIGGQDDNCRGSAWIILHRLTKEYAWDELKLFKYLETFMTEQEYDEYLRRINREDCQPK